MREEVRQTLASLGQLLRLRTLPEFGPDRFPQPLALPERLGVVRAGDHVADSLASEQPLEVGLATPREVLAALVREDFQRLAEALDAFP